MDGGIIVNVGKVAILTVVMSRVSKSIGQKEISEIIVCVGVLACGVYIIQGLTPLVKGIQEFGNNFNAGMQGLNNFFDKLTFWN